ncbi:hypothetical protein DCAR_0934541 [Daucus carota subsp. sativus]|uniref:Uncharacterized protein n=1 Tax=Daucus carota subsp. sativus TaxID=79200 RepID=A0A175YLQ8_DAUCS|nr:hypothetical protein DCAR_0934541 [Daucus carota subsp. sativus]
MATQIGLTIIVLVLLMSIPEIKGGNRFGSIDMVASCCRKGGAVYPSAESLTPTPSPSELPLTLPPILADSPYRGGTGQPVVTTGKASP